MSGGCVEVGVSRWVCRGGCVEVGVEVNRDEDVCWHAPSPKQATPYVTSLAG